MISEDNTTTATTATPFERYINRIAKILQLYHWQSLPDVLPDWQARTLKSYYIAGLTTKQAANRLYIQILTHGNND